MKIPFPLQIPCPHCKRLVGERCRNYKGQHCAPHRERMRAADPLELPQEPLRQADLFLAPPPEPEAPNDRC